MAGNIQKISDGHTPAYTETEADTFLNGQVTIVDEEGNTTTAPYAQMALNTSIEMKGLQVVDTYTTTNEESSSKGAFTLTCRIGGMTISVRTTVLLDENGNLVTADAYEGKTITVRGIVDYYNGSYQIKVFSKDNIQIQ